MAKKISLLIIPIFVLSFAVLHTLKATATEIPDIDLSDEVAKHLNEEVYSVTFNLSTNTATTDDGEQVSIGETLDISDADVSALADTDHLDELLAENLVGDVKISGDKVTVTNPYSLDTLLVEVEDETVLSDYDPEEISKLSDGFYVINLSDATTTKSTYEEMSNDPAIIDVVPDTKVYALADDSSTTLDPLSIQSVSRVDWGVTNTGMDHYTDWINYLNGNDDESDDLATEVIVGVLDTGINPNHEAFIGSDNNSRIYLDGTGKYNYYTNSDDVASDYRSASSNYAADNYIDDQGHGTACSGLIAESTPDQVKIFPIKVLNKYGSGKTSDIVQAIIDKLGVVDIFNLSLGASLSDYDNDQSYYNATLAYFDNAIKSALDTDETDSILVAAAGNNAENSVAIPAASEYVVAVSATDENRNFADTFPSGLGSNYGQEVDFAMPGKDNIVPYYGSNTGYAQGSGTSFSTPYLSAAAALLKISNPDHSDSELYSDLKSNAADLGATGWDEYFGWGLIDFEGQLFDAPFITASSSLADNKISANIDFSIFSAAKITSYAITQSSNYPSTGWQTISSAVYGSSYTFNDTTTVTDDGTYYIWAKDSSGNIANVSVDVSGILKPADITPGVYTIKTALDRTGERYLDVNGASYDDGAKIQLWSGDSSNNTNLAQQFYFEQDSDGYYTIKNIKSGKYLDATAGGRIVQWTGHGGDNQKWNLLQNSNGYIIIMSKLYAGNVIDIANGSTTPGTDALLWTAQNSTNQQFIITAAENYIDSSKINDKTFNISSAKSSKLVLDIADGSINNGANLLLWSKNISDGTYGSKNQQFSFRLNSDGATYTIVNVATGKALDVAGGAKTRGANVLQWDVHGGENQKWLILDEGDDVYSIRSLNGGLYLDIDGGYLRAGSNIQIWDEHDRAGGNGAQLFKLDEVL